jgi:hypothetical protein
MVTFEVPVTAVLLTVNVSVELPLPGAAIGLGLKLAVTPVGKPAAESDTAELKPLLIDVEIVVLPEVPCVTDSPEGDAATVKSGAVAALTVRATIVVWVAPPPLAVTVTFEVPVVAVLLDEKVRVELPFPGAEMEGGLKLAVTPAGNPDTDNEIAELKPPLTPVEIVVAPEFPCVTESAAGEAAKLKSGVVLGLKMIFSTGCNSIWFGAAPVCPCGKSNIPTPVICTGMFAVWKLVVAVNLASNSERALVMPLRKGLPEPTHEGAGISVIMVLPDASWITR